MEFKTALQTSVSAPVAVDLMWWSQREWSDGVQLEALAPLVRLAVRTRNTLYAITVLSPRTGEVLVQGGQFFPAVTRATLAGCSLGGSFLKVRAIHLGFLMELLYNGQTIITTRVQSITPIPETAALH